MSPAILHFFIIFVYLDECFTISIHPFPVEDLFDASFTEKIEEYRFKNLCGTTNSQSAGCCYCDAFCVRTKSCCLDYLWYNSNMSFSSLSIYLDYIVEESKRYSPIFCIDILPWFSKVGYFTSPYYAIASCENGRNEQELCYDVGNLENMSLPVVDSNGLLYKNQHCARCNSVEEFKAVPLKFHCEGFEPAADSCHITIDMIKTRFWPCSKMIRCKPGNIYYDLCHSFLGPVNEYANYFCYLCENDAPKDQYELEFSLCSFDPINAGLTWSFLLQFNDKAKRGQGVRDRSKRCDNKQVFDALKGNCSSFFCPEGYEVVGSMCKMKKTKLKLNSLKGDDFDSCFNNSNINIAVVSFSNRSDNLNDVLGMNSSENITFESLHSKNGENINLLSTKHYHESMNEYLSGLQTYGKKLRENEKIILSPYLSSLGFSHNMRPSQMFSNHRYCLKTIMLNASSYNFTKECKIKFDNKVIDDSNFVMWIEVNTLGTAKHVSVCETFYKIADCPLQKLDANLTLLKNKTLVQRWNDGDLKVYSPDEYTPLANGQYGVCIDTNKETSDLWQIVLNQAETYLSTIGTICSVIGYIMVIATFLFFKEIRNTPSFCAACLCICLFFADGVLLLTNAFSFFHIYVSKFTCTLMGIVMHFWLLSSQFWGVVMAVDIRCNATSMLLDRSFQKTRLVKLAATAFSSSSFIVILTNVFDHFGVFYISYSQGQICALQGFYAKIVFYAVPLLISLITSLALLCSYMVTLSREKNMAQHSLGNRYSKCINLGKIALKLIMIFGLSEISGFIRIHKDVLSRDELIFNYIFQILYSTVRGFRGVMLFVVYVYRKPVIVLYRNCMTKRGNQSEENSPSNWETV